MKRGVQQTLKEYQLHTMFNPVLFFHGLLQSVFTVGFDVTDYLRLLIRFSASITYERENERIVESIQQLFIVFKKAPPS
jgi:hypothetical protein